MRAIIKDIGAAAVRAVKADCETYQTEIWFIFIAMV